jgi:hypothetical protein
MGTIFLKPDFELVHSSQTDIKVCSTDDMFVLRSHSAADRVHRLGLATRVQRFDGCKSCFAGRPNMAANESSNRLRDHGMGRDS